MIRALLIALLLALATLSLPPLATAQTALSTVALHKSPAPATPAANAAASAIIPGSPLAAITGAGAPPAQPAPDPFGTDSLGLSLINHVTADARSTISDFLEAVRRSTELTPVIQWLKTFATNPGRRALFADATEGLILTILPALIAEVIIRFALTKPRTSLVRYAVARRKIDFPEHQNSLDNAEIGDIEDHPNRVSIIAWLRRLGLALAWILLALLPIVAFAAITGILLGTSLITTRSTHLIATGAGNAYLFWRFSSEVLRFLLAPAQPDLRLIHTTNDRARRCVRAVSGIVITIGAGAFILTSAEILGLPHDGAQVLGLLIALAVHIEVAIIIWQSRRVVAGWIHGKPHEAERNFGIRHRLASIWHFIALFYVLALWIAYAAGIHNAFGVLLRIVLVFLGALILARLVWFGFSTALDRLLDENADDTRAHPTLRARIRAYNGLLKLLLRAVISSIVIVFMLQGWGINIVPWLFGDPLIHSLINAFIAIIITIAVALVLWEVSNGLINTRIETLSAAGKARQASRLRTLLPMLKATLAFVIFLTAALICLSQIGVNLVPLLAVSGVAGIAIGFGSQKLVQDIITGLFLLLEDAMQVGDSVNLAGMSGTVERLSIRTIRLRGGDGSINIIPFSAVTTVTNQTRDFGMAQLSITVSYNENIDHVTEVLMDIAHKMRTEPQWGAQMRNDLELFGVDSFGDLGIVILGQIRTGPGQHWAVRREFYGRVQKRFTQENIKMPYNHQSFSLDPTGLKSFLEPDQVKSPHQPEPAAALGAASPASPHAGPSSPPQS